MGNRKFRLSNIIPDTLWRSGRKSETTESPASTHLSGPKQSQYWTKPGESWSNKASLHVHSFDQMLLMSSSSRSFDTERLPLCSETEHHVPPLILNQPHRSSVYKSSNSNESPRRRKVYTSKCCHGIRLKQISPRLNGLSNARRSVSGSSSSPCSGYGFRKNKILSETSVTVVKSSANPEKDFKESMVEMIVENDITHLDGLEELLVSYLVLNSDEFHDVIVSVFKDILIGLLTKPTNRIH